MAAMAGAGNAADAAAEVEVAALSLSAISAATTLSTRRYFPLTRSAYFNNYVPIENKYGIDLSFIAVANTIGTEKYKYT